ncbi:MAG: hypothetical protein Q8L81_00130 [Bacteroidota bacterium]|nr:hypothetical protein [Bacteroidota bacterium]
MIIYKNSDTFNNRYIVAPILRKLQDGRIFIAGIRELVVSRGQFSVDKISVDKNF